MTVSTKIDAPAVHKAPWERKDPDPAQHIKSDPAQEAIQQELDKQLEETFPASDAPSLTGGTEGVGKPVKQSP